MTLAEQGASDPAFAITGWIGLVGPVGLPAVITERWVTIVRDFLATPVIRARFIGYGFEPKFLPPANFYRAWQADLPVWTRLIADTGVTLD